MRTLDDLHPFQFEAIGRAIKWPEMALFLDVGLGKSAIGLTAITELMDRCYVHGALVIAPLRVMQSVWTQEARRWEHTKHLTFSLVWGSKRDRAIALRRKAHIYLMNYENLTWMVEHMEKNYVPRGTRSPFNMVIFDELPKMANPTAVRSKAWRRFRTSGWIDRVLGMTATPATNGLIKLFGEYLALDGGEALGTSKEAFQLRYFSQNPYTYQWKPDAFAKEKIFKRVRKLTYAVEGDEYVNVPPITYADIPVELEGRAGEIYREVEQDFFTSLPDGETMEVFNAAAMTNKCLQISNGTMYTGSPLDKPRKSVEIHDFKLLALDELIEEMQGNPLLVCYPYKLDRMRIKARYTDLNVADVQDYKMADKCVADFQAGKIDILTGHPASMAHGIDGLQFACNHIVWFGLVWDLEGYTQANGRLSRQGQKKPVVVHRILGEGTLDYAVLAALDGKAHTQKEFLNILRDYSKQRKEIHHDRTFADREPIRTVA